MSDAVTRLAAALADRYLLERELGAERLVQEITTTAALQHPRILPLFDSGTADGFLFGSSRKSVESWHDSGAYFIEAKASVRRIPGPRISTARDVGRGIRRSQGAGHCA